MNNMDDIQPSISTKASSENSSNRLDFEHRFSTLDFGTNMISAPSKKGFSPVFRSACSAYGISNKSIECNSSAHFTQYPLNEDTHDRIDELTGHAHIDENLLMLSSVLCIEDSAPRKEVYIEGLDMIDQRLSELHFQDDNESYHSIAQDSLDVMKRRMEMKIESKMITLRDFRRRFTNVVPAGSALDCNAYGHP
jgi:hypothetical protein